MVIKVCNRKMKSQSDNQGVLTRQGFVPLLIFLILFGLKLSANADTLYLKNGRSIQGIIRREDDLNVNLEIGYGEVTFSKDQIDKIQRSSPEGAQLIRQGWVKDKEASEARAREIQEQREHEPKQAALMDKQSGHMTVEAVLNRKVKAKLVLDTGASIMVLTSKVAASLGLNPTKVGRSGNLMELLLADGRKVVSRRVILDSVNVQGSEVEQVEAAILPEQENNVFPCDGLLGMSFLKNFSFKIDQKNDKLVLEKL